MNMCSRFICGIGLDVENSQAETVHEFLDCYFERTKGNSLVIYSICSNRMERLHLSSGKFGKTSFGALRGSFFW
ncbi:MAG: hypothetical protein ACJA2P_002163, partial [Rhodoferax sp.]